MRREQRGRGTLAEAPHDGDEATPGVAVAPTAPQDSNGGLPQRPVPTAASPWNQVVGGPQDDVGTGVATAPSGDVAVVVYSTPRQDEEREPVEGEKLALTLARYAADGAPRWSREWARNRFSDTRVAASEAATFLSGNAFLYSADFGLGEAQDGFLVKFDAAGSPVWQHRVGQKVYAIAADAQGGVLAAGEEWEGSSSRTPCSRATPRMAPCCGRGASMAPTWTPRCTRRHWRLRDSRFWPDSSWTRWRWTARRSARPVCAASWC
ncbi:hypothetical protein QEG98_36895 [Myxococcus sp. MxC21-1]|uniref:hypothetical protein n=1 Tax=Myxococcus sp. MxC21-1 TaxID=3041439 RepID=UPI0029307438|nr:hypothetical protein [Myxococcus sp. MxC21-1]WNZ61397.1 hypothetical protein QEG98_36895 [Myxococcus sp. MxC21-1]